MKKEYKPEGMSEFEFFDSENNSNVEVKIIPSFSGKLAKRWYIIVECWRHRLTGRGKREYQKEFTEQERKLIAKYQTKLYRWYLVSGAPVRFSMKFSTFELLDRAASFFYSL